MIIITKRICLMKSMGMVRKALFILTGMVLVCSCGGGSNDEPVDVSKSYITVTPTVDMLGSGDTKDVEINANCGWRITNNSSDWLTVNPMEGEGNKTVTVTAGKNTTGSLRTAVLTITGGGIERKVTINQNLPDEELTVYPSELNFKAIGETLTLNIVSNGNWSIEVPDWCSVSKSSGFSNAELQVTATKNQTANKRDGELVVKGEYVERKVTVHQDVADLATIRGSSVANITASTAQLTFSFDSVLPVTTWGACYSTTNNSPTLTDQHVDKSGSELSATVSIGLQNLSRATRYYVRAYCTSVVGTQYGETLEFTTLDNIPDIGDNITPSTN